MAKQLQLPNGTLVEDVENTFLTRGSYEGATGERNRFYIHRCDGGMGDEVLGAFDEPAHVCRGEMEHAYHDLQEVPHAFTATLEQLVHRAEAR